MTSEEQVQVRGWIAELAAIDLDSLGDLKDFFEAIPDDFAMLVGQHPGPLARERLFAPFALEFEREGLIEWTGRRNAKGQKVWRSKIGQSGTGLTAEWTS